jgi:DNA-binding NtrC family response regulator
MPGKEEKKPQVLIIDDEADVCYLLKGILKQKNIDAAYVNTLADGEDAIEKYAPPVIFLDNHLPDGFGMDYVSTFKKDHPESKIVMLTAHDNFSDRERAYKEGVDFFIGKPFTKEIILKTIERLI